MGTYFLHNSPEPNLLCIKCLHEIIHYYQIQTQLLIHYLYHLIHVLSFVIWWLIFFIRTCFSNNVMANTFFQAHCLLFFFSVLVFIDSVLISDNIPRNVSEARLVSSFFYGSLYRICWQGRVSLLWKPDLRLLAAFSAILSCSFFRCWRKISFGSRSSFFVGSFLFHWVNNTFHWLFIDLKKAVCNDWVRWVLLRGKQIKEIEFPWHALITFSLICDDKLSTMMNFFPFIFHVG